jgi:LEA14-like dessication related protein
VKKRKPGPWSLLALLLAVLALVACARPEPPRITPKDVRLVAISNTGIEVDLGLAVENPNSIDLDTRSIDATLTFDDGLEIGKTSITNAVHLPAHRTVDMRVPVSLRWKNLSALTPYALRESVPYTIKGEVQLGGALALRVPFSIKGALSRADLMKLALSALPAFPALPGLK